MKVIPDPYYGPAFHDQPILAHEKVRFVGEPVAAVLAADPHVAEEAAQLIVAEYEELPAVYDEVDALTTQDLRPRRAEAGRHLRRPQAPQGRQGHQHRARLPAAPRRRRQGVRRGRARVRARVQDPEGAAPSVRAASPRIADYKDTGVTVYTASQGPSFVRTEIARLLGWPENKVRIKVPYLGSRLRRQALHQARGAGGRAVDDRAAAGEARADLRGAVLPDHQASLDVPHQERRRQGRQDHRAQVRGVLERRRLCRHRPARHAEVRPHRVRPLRDRQRLDRFLRALHQRDAGRRAARLRRAAARVGLREPHRHDRARAQARSGRVPPQEPAARGPPARHRHDHQGRRGREGDGHACSSG